MRGWAPIVLLLAACASSPPQHAIDDLIGQPGVVTLTNLHPDEARGRLFAANYQQIGLLPVCSAVSLLGRSSERLFFRVDATGKGYEYYHHDAAGEPLPDHLLRVFGSACPRAELDALSELDRRGIAIGKALVGMTKPGVLFAMGAPPRHVTPSLEANRWIYWTNRFNRVAVMFDENGLVALVED